MASIDKVSTGWRARYRSDTGQSRSRTFAKKSDAAFLPPADYRR